MSTTRDYILIDADDGAPLVTPQDATDRDREYSAMLYFMQWGCFPGGPEESFWVFSPDGTLARPPTATMPLDHPVHTSSTGRLLKGERREEELERREEQYEAAKKRTSGPSHRELAKGQQPKRQATPYTWSTNRQMDVLNLEATILQKPTPHDRGQS